MRRMATAVMMDTLQISRHLRDAGATEPVAEAMAKTFAESTAVVREDLATKADFEALRVSTKTDIGALSAAIKADLEAFRLSTKADFNALQLEFKGDIAQLETRIQAGQNRLLVWIGGMLIATIGATVTLIKALG